MAADGLTAAIDTVFCCVDLQFAPRRFMGVDTECQRMHSLEFILDRNLPLIFSGEI